MNETENRNAIPGEQTPVAGLAGLRRDFAPQRDLWPGIEARVRARRSRRSQTLWRAAAGFAAVALVGTGVLFERNRAPQDVAVAPPLRAPAEFVAATRPGHDPAMLLANDHSRHGETRALMRVNLKIVSNAEAQLRKAIETDPDSAYLQSLLASTRQQKHQLQVAMNDNGDVK